MLGESKRLEPKLFYTHLSLDERIPQDHFLRRVCRVVDFDFARRAVGHLYGSCGHESLDPAVLLKMMLLVYLEDVSERALAEQLAYRLDWLWFCCYDLDEPTPNHSVLSKARQRWGLEVFSRLFQQVLEQCMAAGLVDGATVHVDASILRANASKDTLRPELRLAAETLYQRLEQQAAAASPAPTPEAVAEPPTATQSADLPPLGRLVSPTDPEARLTRKYGQTVLGYKDHRVVDDRAGIITATVTTDAAVAEAQVLSEALAQHEENTGRAAKTVVADKGYGTASVYQELQERGVKPCIPHQNHKGGQGVGIYESKDFHYDEARDAYLCPQGQWLQRHATTAEGHGRYRAASGVCAACPVRGECTRARDGRRLTRHAGQDWIDWADDLWSREHRRRLLRRRMYRAEGSFADAANRHGYKRARGRGLEAMTMQNLLIATAQNLRKLLRAVRRRPAAAAQERAALRPQVNLGPWSLHRLVRAALGRPRSGILPVSPPWHRHCALVPAKV